MNFYAIRTKIEPIDDICPPAGGVRLSHCFSTYEEAREACLEGGEILVVQAQVDPRFVQERAMLPILRTIVPFAMSLRYVGTKWTLEFKIPGAVGGRPILLEEGAGAPEVPEEHQEAFNFAFTAWRAKHPAHEALVEFAQKWSAASNYPGAAMLHTRNNIGGGRKEIWIGLNKSFEIPQILIDYYKEDPWCL